MASIQDRLNCSLDDLIQKEKGSRRGGSRKGFFNRHSAAVGMKLKGQKALNLASGRPRGRGVIANRGQ